MLEIDGLSLQDIFHALVSIWLDKELLKSALIHLLVTSVEPKKFTTCKFMQEII